MSVAVREWGSPTEPGILLWPGLGATGAYFESIAQALPGRAVAVDPPGFGRSPAIDPCSYSSLVALAAEVAGAHRCRAIVGHSLGAHVAVGLACDPPAGMRAAVLIDGGFLDAATLAELGPPATSPRAEVVAWMHSNSPRFPSWDAAVDGFARMVGAEPTPALEAYVREILVESDGEIHDSAAPERLADMLLAVIREDPRSLAQGIRIPTLLIASGQPADRRAARETAWRSLADASPLIELCVGDGWGHNPVLQDPARVV
ncbi:MAG: alpha/beta fold hydrolase, partial [Solirubrobacteraceae bacterium]